MKSRRRAMEAPRRHQPMLPPPARTRTLVLSRPAVIAGLAVAFALIFGTTILTALSTRDIAAADRQAARTEITMAKAHQVLATANDAAIAVRSFVLTHEEKSLATFVAANARYQREIAVLQARFDGQKVVEPLLVELERLADAHFADLNRIVPVARQRGSLPALEMLDAETGPSALDDLRRVIATLQRHEFSELSEQATAAAERATGIQTLNIALVVTAAALATAVACWLLRRVRDLESLITVCAWTRRVRWQGRWVSFEEYLQDRFNLRCTHGICDEAAERVRQEVEGTPVADELRALRLERNAPVAKPALRHEPVSAPRKFAAT